MKLKIWFLETRPHFLLLSVVILFSGASIAWYDGAFHLDWTIYALLGLILAHISVNVLNDYFDYRSGVDLRTKRTPFSGGSGILPTSQLTPKQVFWLGIGAFFIAISIGIYFLIIRGWFLLPLLIVGSICILSYTPLMLKTRWPELVAGLGLGTLPVLGVYYIQTATYSVPAVIASIPFGILVHNLLLLNEFPDVEADRTVNRKTLPIVIGRRRAGIIYSILTALVYFWIVGCIVIGIMPIFSCIALLTTPLAIKAIHGALNPDKTSNFITAMANNVLVVLLTPVFLSVGYILNGFF